MVNRAVAISGIVVAIIIVGLVVAFGVYRMPLLPSAPPPLTSTTTSTTGPPLSSPTTTTTSAGPSSSSSSSSSTTSLSSSTSTDTSTSITSTTGDGSITVVGENLNNSKPVSGIYVELRINGNKVANGSLPVTFHNLALGVTYGVVVYWYGNYYIRYINDSNTGVDLQRYDLVTLNQSNPSDKLISMFEYVPPSQAASLNIIAEFPNGTKLGTASVVNGYDLHSPGMWLTVTPPFQKTPYTGTFTGGSILPFTFFSNETYTVQMSLGYCGPWVTNLTNTGPIVYIAWNHWQNDNSTNSSKAITLNGSATLTAIYEQVSSCPYSYSVVPANTSYSYATIGFLTVLALVLATPNVGTLARYARRAKSLWYHLPVLPR